jgi:hypothetical protein
LEQVLACIKTIRWLHSSVPAQFGTSGLACRQAHVTLLASVVLNRPAAQQYRGAREGATTMAETKRQAAGKQEQQAAQDRTRRVLDGAVKRLRRLGGRRASAEVKRAYREAAGLVKNLMKAKTTAHA